MFNRQAREELKKFFKKHNINYTEIPYSNHWSKLCDFQTEQGNLHIFLNDLRDYHKRKIGKDLLKNKRTSLEREGVTFFNIFSDEWEEKKSIVLSMLSHRMGLSQRIYARKCQVKTGLANDEIEKFFENTHISGNVPKKESFGLFYNGELVSCLTLRTPPNQKRRKANYLEIARFSTKKGYAVIGGFQKLFKQAKKWARERGSSGIFSYADLRFGKGNVYDKDDLFIEKEITVADMWVSDGEKRYNRTVIQKKQGEILTQNEKMESLGLVKVYGCGSYVFLLPFEELNIPGIYEIKNMKNGKCYIGSSNDISKRWGQHRTDLLKKRHHNQFLQKSWNRHGEKSFHFSILEGMPGATKEKLLSREQEFLDSLQPLSYMGRGFNINPRATGGMEAGTLSEEARGKISKSSSGENNPSATLTKEQVDEIRNNFEEAYEKKRYYIYDTLAEKYNVHPTNIRSIMSGRSWKDPNYIPRKPDRSQNAAKAKITWQQAKEIRQKRTELGLSYKDLSSQYGITTSSIKRIIRNDTFHDPDYHYDRQKSHKIRGNLITTTTSSHIYKCQVCNNYQTPSESAFKNHLKRNHNLTRQQYTITYLLNNIEPTCNTCNGPVKYVNYSFLPMCGACQLEIRKANTSQKITNFELDNQTGL